MEQRLLNLLRPKRYEINQVIVIAHSRNEFRHWYHKNTQVIDSLRLVPIFLDEFAMERLRGIRANIHLVLLPGAKHHHFYNGFIEALVGDIYKISYNNLIVNTDDPEYFKRSSKRSEYISNI